MKTISSTLRRFLKPLGRLPSVATIRIIRRFLIKREAALEFDPDLGSVIEFPELPGLLSIVRILISIGIFLRFFVHREDYYFDGWRLESQIIIFLVFFVNTIAFELIPQFRKKVTTNTIWRKVQIGVDIILISASYFLTYTIESDFFLFYTLPILYGVQYLTFRETFFYTLGIDIVFLITLSSLTILKLDLNPYFVSWESVFLRVYLLRAFTITIIGLVPAFYRKIEYEKNITAMSRASILQRLSTLLRVSEFSDPSLVDNLILIVLAGIVAQDGLGFERAILFLDNDTTGEFKGEFGIGPVNRNTGKGMWERTIEWNFDKIVDLEKRETRFKSQKLNHLISSIFLPNEVVQFVADAITDQKPCIKTTIRTEYPELYKKLDALELDWCVLIPLFSLNRFKGILLVDNIVTNKYIYKHVLDGLILYANLVADIVENVALLKEHVIDETGEVLAGSSTNIAFEIRNPLQAIKGNTELLLRENQNVETEEFLNKILGDANRIENIIKESFIFGDAFTLRDISIVSLESIIKQLLDEDQISAQIMTGNIEIIFTKPDQPQEIIVEINELLLLKALRNILQNAIDAVMDEKAQERKIEIFIDETQHSAKISIHDSGQGISEIQFPDVEKVFAPYETTKTLTEHSGVGLGLSIALAAVRAHKGTIKINNSQQGATFIVTIPKVTIDGSSDKRVSK